MYRFFGKATGLKTAGAEPAITVEKEADLLCTPKGQVGAMGSRTIMSFTKSKAEAMASKRGQLDLNAMSEVLKLPPLPETAPDYRILRSAGNRQHVIDTHDQVGNDHGLDGCPELVA